MENLENVLAGVQFFERLRPDEIARVARRFELRELRPGESASFPADLAGARLVVLIKGRARLEVDGAAGRLSARLDPGDCHGEIALLSERVRPTRVEALAPTTLALLDRAGLDAILDELAAVAVPLASSLALELGAENDLVRQLLELHAEELPAVELASAISERRRALARRGARVTRLSPRALFRQLVAARGREPPFWILLGFLVALGGARLVVALILKYGLEKRLFALVPGSDPNPMHVHHFNYGLILIGLSGLAALAPFGRRALGVLSFAFGAGAGLVFDEFGLIYNLNPEYAQRSSLISAGIVFVLLVQLTYFRRFWAALARRFWFNWRTGR